mmetsp:Transcript_42111/g.78261  ORF Transcript_42111/g.78261 Transcript_42111/m.78261 type:complete len:721 (-) Transcript_42111:88-2250(-)
MASTELVRQLGGNDVDDIIAACEELSSMNAEPASLGKLLSHTEPRVRASAAKALCGMDGAEGHSAALASLVADDDAYVRMAAAESLNSFGVKAASQVSVVGKHLKNSSPGVVAAAAYSLSAMGPSAADIVQSLEDVLSNEAEDISTHMLTAAGVMPKASAALRKPACAAAGALGVLGSASSIPKLMELLNSKDWEIRTAAVTALSQMQLGSETSRFESQLTDLLKDPAPSVSAAACKVLGQMATTGSPSSSNAAAVAELLDDSNPAVRASAVESLSHMGDEAEAFLEPLCKLFNDKSWKVRVAAVKAVTGCGELGQMYAAEVCRLTMNGDARTRVAAVEALAQMGERGACFDEEVEMLMSDSNPEVAAAAKKAIQTFFDMKAAAIQNDVKAVPAIAETPADANHVAPPSGTSPAALLFPGQGSQYVKMMTDVKDMPAVKDMLATAQKILGFDILKLCLEGPEDQLEQTKFCQPAMYIGGLAGLELLRKDNPKAAESPRAVAGLSLGEYTALTVAGVFDFETGLRLVKLRGEAMQQAAEAPAQKMISLAGLSQEVVDKLCSECRSGDEVCQIANVLFPNGFSCAGNKAAIDKLLAKASETEGCLQAKELKTSGAFHTKCMMPAREKLLTALKEVEPKMKPPTCDVYVNLTGQKISAGTPVPQIVDLLADQLTNCVLWMPAMQAMVQDGISEFYECGPMKQLKAMMKRIDMTAWKATQNIHV